jgi:hypothetical protein
MHTVTMKMIKTTTFLIRYPDYTTKNAEDPNEHQPTDAGDLTTFPLIVRGSCTARALGGQGIIKLGGRKTTSAATVYETDVT